jgi:beta-glucosidase
MAQQRVLRFPEGFLWGTASSAYQNEGNLTNNQWYRWEQQGHILTGESSGIAVNWWVDAERDFEFAEQMENNALRLSVEWSRIEPVEGQFESAAIDRYRAMLKDLQQRRLKPMITLHHFTEPLWFADRGGFSSAANIRYFLRYASYVVQSLKDLCSFWLTFNEPNVYATQGYVTGEYPPGEHNVVRAFHVLRNLIQAHTETFYALRRLQPEGMIGYCLNYRIFDPALLISPLDQFVAGIHNTFFNWATLQAAETGHFPFPLSTFLPPVARAAGARDYHGVNYYARELVRFDPTNPGELFGHRFVRKKAFRNDAAADNSFGEIYPRGIYQVLKSIYSRTKGNKPFYITENGFCDALDEKRPRATLQHLAMIHRAIREGIPVHGYMHWSLVDNFEWNNGWAARFGLIELDPRTQQRFPRPSASMYGEICRANAITESIVERFAPDLMDTIFGKRETAKNRVLLSS